MPDPTPQVVTGDVQMGDGAMRVVVRPAETGPDAPPASEARPGWLPEKFKSPEELAKAYGELERQYSQRTPGQSQPVPPVTPPATEAPTKSPTEIPTPPADPAQAAVEGAGLDFAKINAEYGEKGQLSPETYESLAKGGIPRDMADRYIAGQVALAAQLTNDVHTAAGGKETYDAMVTWATANMTPGEIAAYNAQMSGGPDAAKSAASGLAARYQLAMGSAPRLLGGGSPQGDVYESRAQVTADMKNPLYSRDPAFRMRVEAKVARSNVF